MYTKKLKILMGAVFLLLTFSAIGQKNIVFIWFDDAGYNEFGFRNSLWETPNIDTLKDEGVFFSRFYSAVSCSPSRSELHTGLYTYKTGMHTGNINKYDEESVPLDQAMLPQRLKALGYSTALIGKWHQGYVYPEMHPLNRGYDHFFGMVWGQIGYYNYEHINQKDLQQNGVAFDTTGYVTDIWATKATEYINSIAACSDTPFFLHVSLTSPHTPFEAPSNVIAQAPASFNTTEKTRWAMQKIADEAVGEIKQALAANGMLSNTIIIITNDNGGNAALEADNGDFILGKRYVTEGGIRVPFIWWEDTLTNAGTTVDTVCHLVDMVPTLVGQAGGSINPGENLDGVDIYPLVQGGSIAERYVIVQLLPGRTWAIFKGKWKLVNNKSVVAKTMSPVADNIELFDVVADPDESNDLSSTNTSIVNELQAIITAETPTALDTLDLENPRPGSWDNLDLGVIKTYYDPTYYYYRNW
jgi:arylsulfatase A-like enzyme